MGGCWGSSASRQAQTQTYVAILTDIYQLVPFDEQNLKFTKRTEVMKYYDEAQRSRWQQISTHFKQHVKTLIDHIESYKIRLIDTSIYVENKIKLASNPLIIYMSALIVHELVQNLPKFVLQKEVIMTNRDEDSKILDRPDSRPQQGPLSVTYISDNFLRFELIFSAILALLINSKQIQNSIWFDLTMSSLQSFSQQASRPYQSENIHKIIDYLENILCICLGKRNDSIPEMDAMFSMDSEEQRSHIELVDSLTEAQQLTVLSTYVDTISKTEYDKLIFSKPQRAVMRLILLTFKSTWTTDNEVTKLCQRYTINLARRSFKIKAYDELFQNIFQGFDPLIWKDALFIQKILDTLALIAKREGFLSNIEILILSRFLEFIQNSSQELQGQKKTIDFQQNLSLSNKKSLREGYTFSSPREPSIIRTVIQQIGYMITKFESSQFLLFSMENIVRTLLTCLRLHVDDDQMFHQIKETLETLLNVVAPDTSAFGVYLSLLINLAYQQFQSQGFQSLRSGTQSFMDQLLILLANCISNAFKFQSNIFLKEELAYPILQLVESNLSLGVPILLELMTQQIQEGNYSEFEDMPKNTTLFQYPSSIQALLAYSIIRHSLSQPDICLAQGLTLLPQLRNSSLLQSLCLKICYGEHYQALITKRAVGAEELQPLQLALLVRGLLGLQIFPPSKEIAIWANQQLSILDSYKQFREPQVSSISLDGLKPFKLELQPMMIYLEQHEWVDFDELELRMRSHIENLANMNDEIVNVEEIQIKDHGEHGSMNQSFNAQNSFQDIQVDQSFEKVLQNIKKIKQKQGKLDLITTSDQHINL